MNNKRQSIVISVIFFLSLTFLGALKNNSVQADSVNLTSKNLAVRAATVNRNKVIVVPKKETVNPTVKATAKKATVSRGSNGRVDVVSYAYKFMGKPYVWGAAGPSAFDCSGFTLYVYRAFGVNLGHYTGTQFSTGQAVSKENLLPGDLVFFNTDSSISHVGIYVGEGQFIHASSGSGKVIVSSLSGSYYDSRYAGARRVLQ
ncbi:cell wall-associated NlpC family hydrolase [Clostridium pascui]|uniref:C40 family peptidase n=1 Tax=Clostridium pascui TaxID=46609 RepID=UPI001958174F|nr:C40 family peptidase [Clostridium pascui]MBM7870165.1 cell wall-associated NlpC family hydrolase [Clostridium pascui]